MSIQNIQNGIQTDLEQYKIRKQNEVKQNEELQEQIQNQEVQQIDEYDKNNPVGEEVEGIYSISHDDDGNLKVNYRQPETKSTEAETQGAKPSGNSGGGINASSEDDSTEDEIEELKEQRDSIKQQLNRETDETVKSQLRAQVQSLEVQIALKSSSLK